MRIIAGKFKNKKIIQPVDQTTRPLKDLTKESIFNIIEHSPLIKIQIENSNILDLFSGSGSFGLECISRGACKIIFCESYKPVLNILKKNINNLNCEDNTQVFDSDIFKILKNKESFKEKFDIIFLDPPFKEKKIYEILDVIKNTNLLKKDGIIILHRNKKDKDNFPSLTDIIIEKTYGRSKIFFINF